MKKKNVKDKQKKKVSKATKGMEEFYRKKKVGDKLKFAFLTVIILFSFAMLMAFIAILLISYRDHFYIILMTINLKRLLCP